MKWLLFTTNPCPGCKTMKDRLRVVGIKYDTIDMSKPGPQYDPKKFFFVRSAPTLVIMDGEKIIDTFGLLPVSRLAGLKKKHGG